MSKAQLTPDQNTILEDLQTILNKKLEEEQNSHSSQLTVVHHGGAVIPTPRECDRVYENIFISGEKTARDIERLTRDGFTHVINCAQGKRFGQVDTDSSYYAGSSIKYLGIPGHDSVKYDITPHLYAAAEFVKSSDERGKILIHCHQGISRSAAVTIGCLMFCYHLTASDALQSILQHRLVRPNNGFLRQLAVLQDTLNSSQ